jgi:4'-phosphopantetheinyl transferase
LVGRAKVASLSRHARRALDRSAEWSGVQLESPQKDVNGVPLPSRGIYWSLSHKERFVAAVVGWQPVGVDLEMLRGFSRALFARVAAPAEWDLAPRRDDRLLLRYWTAKEAVLKAVGVGLTGLSRCRVIAIENERRVTVAYGDRRWYVTHCWIGHDHLAAVTDQGREIRWHILPEGPSR